MMTRLRIIPLSLYARMGATLSRKRESTLKGIKEQTCAARAHGDFTMRGKAF